MTEIQRLMVPGQHEPYSHYCHVVRAGPHIWISGAVGVSASGEVPPDVVEQFALAMRNRMRVCGLPAAGPSTS